MIIIGIYFAFNKERWLRVYYLTEKYLESFKNSNYSNLLLEEIVSSGISLSSDDHRRATLLAAFLYNKVFIDCVPMLQPLKDYLEKHPLLFSIFDIPDNYLVSKELIFTATNLASIAEKIISPCLDSFKKLQLNEAITVFTFTQKHSTEDDLSNPSRFFEISRGYSLLNDLRHKLGSHEVSSLSIAWIDSKESAHLTADKLEVLKKSSNNNSAYLRKDLQHFFRSSWEANLARVFEHYKLSWEYEPERFKQGIENPLFYWPDFMINQRIVVEVKGIWDSQSLKKVSAFHKKYPNLKMHFIDPEVYKDFDDYYSEIIEHWEKNTLNTKDEVLPVVGLKYVKDQSVFDSISHGSPVRLIREPDNPYDENAICAVTEQGKLLGHIASEWALVYSFKMDSGFTYDASIETIGNTKIDIKVKRNNYNHNRAQYISDIWLE